MPTDGKKDYEVGYARPPKRARFKKGHSGNPKGRPRGSRKIATLLAKALDERVVVVENGRRKAITKREAFCKQLVNRGLKEPRSAKLLLDEIRLLSDTEGGPSEIKQRGGVEVPLPPPLTAKQQRAEAIKTLKIMYETGVIEANLRAANEEIIGHHHGRSRVRGVGVDSTDGKR